jgi:two-component system OmpR family response regulator
MLTAKGRERDVLGGLSAGAVDYIVKPFSLKDLVARIDAALRT